jgi:glycosyltransferase involved in cell wall biosynthesis
VIDTRRFAYSWTEGRRLAHSPSTHTRKGTATLLAALDGLDIEFDLIQRVSHAECLERKQRCNLFFDQAGREDARQLGVDDVIGWYANAALEAAVHGIPTIAHLSEDAFAGAERGGQSIRERCAIINTPLDEDGIRRTIETFFGLEPDERRALSLRTRRWVEEFHSYEAVGPQLAALYDRVRRRRREPAPWPLPTTGASSSSSGASS